MERPFDIQLEKLKTKLIKMCSLVDEQVELVIKAVLEHDHELAGQIAEKDDTIDKYDVKIEKICQKLFALNQPVAMDLRLVMSALKINSNLERVGDLTVIISHNIKDLNEKPAFFDNLNFEETARKSQEMIKKAIDSFIYNDPNLARAVMGMDDKLDDAVKNASSQILSIMKESPDNVEAGMIYHRIFQEIERIGDHAANICEEVYFIVKARTLKHEF